MLRARALDTVLILAAVLALLVAQGVTYEAVAPLLQDGRGISDDGYTWLGRAERLHDGGTWYDRTHPRINWPFGEIQHQHRPFDVVLLAGASILAPVLGFEKGLFWWGALVAPLCYLLLGLGLAWAVAGALGVDGPRAGVLSSGWRRGVVAALLLPTQFAILNYAIAGRADHHTLIMLVFVLVWGLVSRLLRRPGHAGTAILGGLVTGLGLWLTLEFLVMTAASFAVLALTWIRAGRPYSRAVWLYASGFLVTVLVAVLLERSPLQLAIPSYDRLSLVHLALAFLAWAVISVLAWRDLNNGTSRAGRVGLVLGGTVFAIGGIAVFFPQFLLGPIADLDPRAHAVLVSTVTEELGLWPTSRAGLERLVLMLGLGIVAIPGLVWLLVTERSGQRAAVWHYLGLLSLIYIAASLFMMRFAPYAEVLFVIVTAELVVRALDVVNARAPGWNGGIPVAGLAVAVLASGLLAGTWANARTVGHAFETPHPCHRQLKELSAFLEEEAAGRAEPLHLAAMPDVGPELLYRTHARVLATPSRSNEEGAITLFELFGDVDGRLARQIVRERSIDHFLMCRALRLPESLARSERLYSRLARGVPPTWLERVPLPADLRDVYDLYRVR